MPLATIEEALEELQAGRMVVVVDDEDRENEGDLIMAAEKVTPQNVNFMATYGRGLICVALTGERLDALGLSMMVRSDGNVSRFHTAFTVSVDLRHGTTTGISAPDRALTIRALVDPETQPEDLAKPGHIFPLRAKEGGVMERTGHTEAAVDLCRLAGLSLAGVICEILADDGRMARLPELERYAKHHELKIISVKDLVAYRHRCENSVKRLIQTRLPTEHGEFSLIAYQDTSGSAPHMALVMGNVSDGRPVLARVHSECLTGEVLGSLRCDCGPQLTAAMGLISAEGRGVLIYLRQEGRGIGLHNKLRAYALQDGGLDTVEANECLGFAADLRDYGVAAEMLLDLGVQEVRLLTNNLDKLDGLEKGGVHVVEQKSLAIPANKENGAYLRTKRDKMGHLLSSL